MNLPGQIYANLETDNWCIFWPNFMDDNGRCLLTGTAFQTGFPRFDTEGMEFILTSRYNLIQNGYKFMGKIPR